MSDASVVAWETVPSTRLGPAVDERPGTAPPVVADVDRVPVAAEAPGVVAVLADAVLADAVVADGPEPDPEAEDADGWPGPAAPAVAGAV